MATNAYAIQVIYYQIQQESINYITEVDPDRKQAIAQRIVNLWAQLNILLQAPVPGFQGFQPPPPPPPSATAPST